MERRLQLFVHGALLLIAITSLWNNVRAHDHAGAVFCAVLIPGLVGGLVWIMVKGRL